MTFLADFLQNTSNALSNIGISTPELGLTEQFGGSSVTPNHVQDPTQDITAFSPQGPSTYDYVSNPTGTVNNVANTSSLATSPATLAQLSQYDQAIQTINDAIGRSGNQLGIAQGNINNQFGVNQNELNTAKTNAQQSYDQSGVQNQQALRTNKNQIADQASQGLRGLLRTLGAYGAGGSSEALYNAPQAVAGQASQQRAGAGQTFAQNQQGLDTNFNQFLGQDTASRQKLDDWRTQQLNSVQSQTDTTKQSLLQKLADLQGQRAQASGGGYASAAQPYIDQANDLSGQIDQLGAINPTYQGTVPTYQAPSLSSYLNSGNTAVKTGGASALQDTTSPYLSLLLGNKNKTGVSL